ncbi:kinase-like domain-containing protein, partial [Amanita rubescens]
ILEVAKGIQYIHAEGIVHGDLRGENVLLDSDFHCRIANFGLAQASDSNFPPQSTTTLDSSDPSPEQSGIVDERPRDVHAFGCLYYEVSALKSAAHLTVTVLGIFRCYAFPSAKRIPKWTTWHRRGTS